MYKYFHLPLDFVNDLMFFILIIKENLTIKIYPVKSKFINRDEYKMKDYIATKQ